MTTPKLTDTQLVILTQAAQHPRLALTIPPRLKGGAVSKVIGPLLAKGIVHEVEHAPDLPVYRTREDGSRMALVITSAGLTAIGIEPDEAAAPKPARGRKAGVKSGKRAKAPKAPKAAQEPAKSQPAVRREGTKQAQLIAMLERKEGATIAQIVEATGWLPHTVRGAIAGALKKRLGLEVTSAAEEGRGRVYRIHV